MKNTNYTIETLQEALIGILDKIFKNSHVYEDISAIPEVSGVYVVFTKNETDNSVILDVGEAQNMKERILKHDREPCWQAHKIKNIYYWIIPCDEEIRMILESALRKVLNPPCGER